MCLRLAPNLLVKEDLELLIFLTTEMPGMYQDALLIYNLEYAQGTGPHSQHLKTNKQNKNPFHSE